MDNGWTRDLVRVWDGQADAGSLQKGCRRTIRLSGPEGVSIIYLLELPVHPKNGARSV